MNRHKTVQRTLKYTSFSTTIVHKRFLESGCRREAACYQQHDGQPLLLNSFASSCSAKYFVLAIQQKYKAAQIESSTCNCSTKGWLWQLWIVAVVDILTWAVADLYCCFLLLQIVIVVVLYFVQKLALAAVDCYCWCCWGGCYICCFVFCSKGGTGSCKLLLLLFCILFKSWPWQL